MKVDVVDAQGNKTKKVDLPSQFSEEVRPDLIQRAVLAVQSTDRQPYGTNILAGTRQVVKLSRRRRQFKTSYGHGISRVPRKALWHRGRQFGWVGAFAPGTVKGRKANPPKAEKIWAQKINIKEKRKAVRSALAATLHADLVKLRGHRFKELFPVIDAKMEFVSKAKEVEAFFYKIGLADELTRVAERRVRAGKGKVRNRPYKIKKGPLLVVSQQCPLVTAAQNIPGVEVCIVTHLNASLLAPGCMPGRLTLFTEQAMDRLAKEQLFMPEVKLAKKEKVVQAPKVVAKPVVAKASPKKVVKQ
ncbi:MAG: 50S ribosomal protein L4 [Nanoarchaeota archaeon]|nr:50S ribosomal protein L4 [Nanoarchaeota archaeon]